MASANVCPKLSATWLGRYDTNENSFWVRNLNSHAEKAACEKGTGRRAGTLSTYLWFFFIYRGRGIDNISKDATQLEFTPGYALLCFSISFNVKLPHCPLTVQLFCCSKVFSSILAFRLLFSLPSRYYSCVGRTLSLFSFELPFL